MRELRELRHDRNLAKEALRDRLHHLAAAARDALLLRIEARLLLLRFVDDLETRNKKEQTEMSTLT